MNRVLKNKECWSAEELRELEHEWNSDSGYENVKASHIQDCKVIELECPSGCSLTIHKPNYCDNEGWYIMPDEMTCRRKTVFCREHGFTRIYVISENNYSKTT